MIDRRAASARPPLCCRERRWPWRGSRRSGPAGPLGGSSAPACRRREGCAAAVSTGEGQVSPYGPAVCEAGGSAPGPGNHFVWAGARLPRQAAEGRSPPPQRSSAAPLSRAPVLPLGVLCPAGPGRALGAAWQPDASPGSALAGTGGPGPGGPGLSVPAGVVPFSGPAEHPLHGARSPRVLQRLLQRAVDVGKCCCRLWDSREAAEFLVSLSWLKVEKIA